MSAAGQDFGHASLMDEVYRRQRYFYDVTRKFYLIGRDRMLEELAVPDGGSVLELGCGTGRNLVRSARLYPRARLYGLDISAAMLDWAEVALRREGIAGQVRLAAGDATEFDAAGLFGERRFDRIFFSYALSMIPDWEKAVVAALDRLTPGGRLSIVDFGRQDRLPAWSKRALRMWLAHFHVTPRDALAAVLERECARRELSADMTSPLRGYAFYAVAGRNPDQSRRSTTA